MELLRVNDLTLSFHEGKGVEEVVQHVNFSLDQGEVLGIVGESGSGKSMVVHCIMGLYKKNEYVETCGTITKDPKCVSSISDKKESVRQTAGVTAGPNSTYLLKPVEPYTTKSEFYCT